MHLNYLINYEEGHLDCKHHLKITNVLINVNKFKRIIFSKRVPLLTFDLINTLSYKKR